MQKERWSKWFSCFGLSEYQELFQVSKRTSSNDLSELTAHGLLVVEGAGRAVRYRLAEPST